ncbi:hypothetical protein AB0D78_22455 [Streptomyces avermitilis]|uniref:hypothetical protein n=1 Tax=Streptomyces avermitilis TaxID=33903 RepID=UPI0033CCD729
MAIPAATIYSRAAASTGSHVIRGLDISCRRRSGHRSRRRRRPSPCCTCTPDGPRLTELIGEPPLKSDAFLGLWGDHDAQAHTTYRLGRSYWDWLMIQSRMPGIA